MFLGVYRYQMDEKGRVPLPRSLRRKSGGRVIAVKGRDGCIEVHPESNFKKITDGLKKQLPKSSDARRSLRFISLNAVAITPDKQGRIAIQPDNLRKHASLKKGTVVIVGMLDYVEIWALKVWQKIEGGEGIVKEAEAVARAVTKK